MAKYKVIKKDDGSAFCGWHDYVEFGAMGNERWNDRFPYWEGQGYPVIYYDTYEEADKARNTMIYCDTLAVVKVNDNN